MAVNAARVIKAQKKGAKVSSTVPSSCTGTLLTTLRWCAESVMSTS